MERVYVCSMQVSWLLVQTSDSVGSFEPGYLFLWVFSFFFCDALDTYGFYHLLLQKDSSNSAFLTVGLCIFFHQLWDEDSLMINGVVTNLVIGDGQFRLFFYYC